MEFGICLPNFALTEQQDLVSTPFIIEAAKTAEKLNYHSIWVTDHIVLSHDYTRLGPLLYEPVAVLSYVAAVTQRIALGTSVLVIPYRNPVILAKALATIDQMSNGRLIYGAAAGHMKEEFDALAVPLENRGTRSDEYLQVIEALWTQENPSFSGDFFRFADIHFQPKPLQKPRPPIWIGGRSQHAIRRAVQLGDAWFPFTVNKGLSSANVSIDELKVLEDGWNYAQKLSQQTSRAQPLAFALRVWVHLTQEPIPPKQRAFLTGSPDQLRADIAELKALGITHLVMDIFAENPEAFLYSLERFPR